jgi:hypothetical protein
MVVIAARIGGEEIPPKPDSKADKSLLLLFSSLPIVPTVSNTLLGRKPHLRIARFSSRWITSEL